MPTDPLPPDLSVKKPEATMTLNLSRREMAVVEQLAADKDLSKTAVLRQALRLYQLVDHRLRSGERMYFSGDVEREMLFVGGLGDGNLS